MLRNNNPLNMDMGKLANRLFTPEIVQSSGKTAEELKNKFQEKYAQNNNVLEAVMSAISNDNVRLDNETIFKKHVNIKKAVSENYSIFLKEKELSAAEEYRQKRLNEQLEKDALERQNKDAAQGSHTPQQGLLDQIDHVLGINLESLVFKALFSVMLTPGYFAIFLIKNVFEDDPKTAMELLTALGNTIADTGGQVKDMIEGSKQAMKAAHSNQSDVDATLINAAQPARPLPKIT